MASKHYLSNYLNTRNYTSIKNGDMINDNHIDDARHCLKQDCDAFMLNGVLSFVSAINSVKKNNYSWAFVQCYYTFFYMAEALLAAHDIGIYYINTTPFSIKLSKGESFKKQNGNSHKVVLSLFKDFFDGDTLLCGEIEGIHIIDWFNKKREQINYRDNPMTDPIPPTPLYRYNNNLRTWISNYQTEILYSFNPNHSYIAFSLRLIEYLIAFYQQRNMKNAFITNDVMKHIKKNCCDSKGPFKSLIDNINKIV